MGLTREQMKRNRGKCLCMSRLGSPGQPCEGTLRISRRIQQWGIRWPLPRYTQKDALWSQDAIREQLKAENDRIVNNLPGGATPAAGSARCVSGEYDKWEYGKGPPIHQGGRCGRSKVESLLNCSPVPWQLQPFL